MEYETTSPPTTDTLKAGLKALRDMRARLVTHQVDLELIEKRLIALLIATEFAKTQVKPEWFTLREAVRVTRRELTSVLNEMNQINTLINQGYLQLQLLAPSEAEAAFRTHLESLVIHTTRQTRLVCYTFDETMEIMAKASEQLESL